MSRNASPKVKSAVATKTEPKTAAATGPFAGARLGVNIDHVATLRQLRGTPYPSLVEIADLCAQAGADQITIHLREDRRHIQDADVKLLRAKLKVPMNFEMAVTEEMTRIALRTRPDWVCLVPEKRREVTTEGGLELKNAGSRIRKTVARLQKAGIKVSLFVEPTEEAVRQSAALGADAVELHTGRFCLETQRVKPKTVAIKRELKRIADSGALAWKLGIGSHAGHGFDLMNVRPVAALEVPADLVAGRRESLISEFNIGHFIVCRAVVVGFERAVREMISAIRAP